jgi:hypothetical protein
VRRCATGSGKRGNAKRELRIAALEDSRRGGFCAWRRRACCYSAVELRTNHGASDECGNDRAIATRRGRIFPHGPHAACRILRASSRPYTSAATPGAGNQISYPLNMVKRRKRLFLGMLITALCIGAVWYVVLPYLSLMRPRLRSQGIQQTTRRVDGMFQMSNSVGGSVVDWSNKTHPATHPQTNIAGMQPQPAATNLSQKTVIFSKLRSPVDHFPPRQRGRKLRDPRQIKLFLCDDVLTDVYLGIVDYCKIFGEFPQGDGVTISYKLRGMNPRHMMVLAARAEEVGVSGEFIDPWGTPLRITFDQSGHFEVRSAGEDKIFNDDDDAYITDRFEFRR